MNFQQSFRLALKSLAGSKMRAFLTMLGIIIGVGAVIVIVSLFSGMTKDITDQFESMGTNLLNVSVMGRGSNRQVTPKQMQEFVKENSDVISCQTPQVQVSATVKNEVEELSSSVTGVNEYYIDIGSYDMGSGRFLQFIDADRRQKVCVIGSYQAAALFPGENPIGQTLKINGEKFTVVGVLEEKAESKESSTDDIVFIPYTVATKMSRQGTVSSYSLSTTTKESSDEAMERLENFLYGVFGNDDAYMVMNQAEMIEMINEMTGTMAMVMAGIAEISLLVGGIGIMNIMLVSVTERTREIGIRKSVGAKRRDSMGRFVIEAGTTSEAGGVLGIFFGIGLSIVLGKAMDMSVSTSWSAVLIAFGVSVAIGVIFGYLPASKASKLNPIDALRYD